MFSKLRNKFILTNIITSSIIVVMAFLSIYLGAMISQNNHKPRDVPKELGDSQEVQEVFERELDKAHSDQLGRLVLVLIMVGVITEFLVFAVSYYLAEKAIEPVKNAYLRQREFIANASHELKTPIAAARANFEALGTDEQPWTDNVDMELERASCLVNSLLTLARTDGRSVRSTKKDVDLAKIVKRHAQLIEARLSDKKLELDLPKELKVKIADADFAQVTDILLDNAVKYSKSKIVVKLTTKALSVENDGKTIPPSKLPYVFERFYQTDKTAEGSGLGLAIAKAVCDQNRWKIVAESDKKSTKFTLSF